MRTDPFIISYIFKIPGDPIGKVISILNQWNRVLNSNLTGGFAQEVVADTVGVITKQSKKILDENACEGVALMTKYGRKDLAEQVLATSTATSGELACRGVRVAQVRIEQAGMSSGRVNTILNAPIMDAALAEKAFVNIHELDGVPGLAHHVKLLSDNLGSVDQINGAIFEGTVAVKIRNGSVAGAGTLSKIDDGFIAAPNDKIDILTANWAGQAKFKKIQPSGFPDPYGWDDFPGGQAAATRLAGTNGPDDLGGYLVQFLSDAQSLGKTPVWITNGALESSFATWLQQNGILHIIVAP